jgi:hypothetical protein
MIAVCDAESWYAAGSMSLKHRKEDAFHSQCSE